MKQALVIIAMFTATLVAAEVDVSLKNPATQKIQARMDSRAAKIEQWKNNGTIGEAASGMLEVLSSKKQSLVESKEVRDLVDAENGDRTALFRELLHANRLDASQLPGIAATFAKSRRQAAAAAHMVQSPRTKEWVAKKDFRD